MEDSTHAMTGQLSDNPCENEAQSTLDRRRSGRKRHREPDQQQQGAATDGADQQGSIETWLPELSLQVKWTSVSGKCKVTHLPLNSMPRWDCTTGLHKRLVARVFSDTDRPPSLTCAQYLQFNTSEECLNYPLDIARTTFRLVADHEGWQYVIHESHQHQTPLPNVPDFLHVVSIEFETVARVIGHLGIRMSMICYPVVAINKARLQEVVTQMRTDPHFKGIL